MWNSAKFATVLFLFGEMYGRRCELGKKKTHDEYVVELLTKEINIIPVEEYKTANVNIIHKCNMCENEWSSRPSNILNGYGCPKCASKRVVDSLRKTHDEYIKELEQLNPNIVVLGEYINKKTKILHRCNVCNNEWKTTPNTILNGCGCPVCSEKIRAFNRIKTQDAYCRQVNNLNPNIAVVGAYVLATVKILHKCKKCDYEWYASPSSILQGRGCPECAIKKQSEKQAKTHEQYAYEINKINPNIEVIGKYKNAKTKILHRCKKCKNEWDIMPSGILSGNGCPECAKNLLRNIYIMTKEEFIEKLKKTNNKISLIGDYNGTSSIAKFECNSCGNIWEARTSNVLYQNCGCVKCSEKSKGEVTVKDYLDNSLIDYYPQKKFSGLKGLGGRLLSYDFYLQNYNLLIEFQGEQHYEPVDYFGGKEKLKTQQEHDKRKRDYAKLHNINLLEIRYDEDVNTILNNYFNNVNNSNNLNSESRETVMPTVAI